VPDLMRVTLDPGSVLVFGPGGAIDPHVPP